MKGFISGIQPFTMLDYPGRIACIAFLPGCNFRCGFCHNPEFVLPELLKKIKSSFISWDVFLTFLKQRRGLLDGVVISGGEPTFMSGLVDLLSRIKKMGFSIKLDSNGSQPAIIKLCIDNGLIDYCAIDIKTSPSEYPKLVGACVRPESIMETIAALRSSSIVYELRTTLIKNIHTESVLYEMADFILPSDPYYLQFFRAENTLDKSFHFYESFSFSEIEYFRESIFIPKGIHPIVRI